MSDKHPYTPTPGGLVKVIEQFRRSLPTNVTSETLKKLGLAPKNESYIINILKFLVLIEDDGTPTELARRVFNLHDDNDFSSAFKEVVKQSYKDLFDLQGEAAWTVENDKLITFFRNSDQTTAIVGGLQAKTFKILAANSGYGELPETKSGVPRATRTTKPESSPKKKPDIPTAHGSPNIPPVSQGGRNIGMTVRIEINLPADGEQETYDRIFKSIRTYLLND